MIRENPRRLMDRSRFRVEENGRGQDASILYRLRLLHEGSVSWIAQLTVVLFANHGSCFDDTNNEGSLYLAPDLRHT